MKKSVEMISLNSTRTEFSEEMNLDERLQRLQSDELKSIRAGASCPSKDCPTEICLGMGCPNECGTRCDANYPVSKTVMEQFITLPIILSGVIAAIVWNLFTWWRGIPSSSSHTLIGGFAGAAIMAHGFDAIQFNIILKIAAFIFLAPLIGMIIAFGFTLLVLYACRRAHPHTAEVWFKKLQLVSSAMFSIGHGLNDSQKVMGIIAAAMIAAHSEGLGMGINSIEDLPDWVAFSCFTAISLGTMSGGWKIVKTMGTRITKVTPLEGVVAETAGAFTLYLTEFLKIPVSTTHTITGAIIGVGATKRLSLSLIHI